MTQKPSDFVTVWRRHDGFDVIAYRRVFAVRSGNIGDEWAREATNRKE